jgi:hypothetical protein
MIAKTCLYHDSTGDVRLVFRVDLDRVWPTEIDADVRHQLIVNFSKAHGWTATILGSGTRVASGKLKLNGTTTDRTDSSMLKSARATSHGVSANQCASETFEELSVCSAGERKKGQAHFKGPENAHARLPEDRFTRSPRSGR